MAHNNAFELEMAKGMIPVYSGGSKNLAYFIKQVEAFIELFRKPEENSIFNRLLFEKVKSKLAGEAQDVLVFSNCTRWSELKDELLQKFGDPRSEELLVYDLTTCFQTSNQSYEQYYQTIKQKLQVLLEHISVRTPNGDIRISKEDMYTRHALSTFKAGILEPYCSHLLNIQVTSMEHALYECRKFDNEKQQIQFMSFMRNRSKPGNANKSPMFHQIKIQSHNNVANRNNFPYTGNNFSNPRFPIPQQNNFTPRPFNIQRTPTQPNNFTPRPFNVPRFPAQQNNNNNNSQVRRSNNNNPAQYTPTPMSITSQNTYRPPQNNFFKSQSRPTFKFEELHNLQENTDETAAQSITDYTDNHYPEYYSDYDELQEIPSSENDFEQNQSENFQETASDPMST